MSRAFVKEDASSEPLIVPPRAPLPEGVVNYVTPAGMALLQAELAALNAELQNLQPTDAEAANQAQQIAVLRGQQRELGERIAIAEVVDTGRQPRDEIRFGASVILHSGHTDTAAERHITIVGVDEADPGSGRVSFLAPVARALLGHGVGDEIVLASDGGEEQWQVVAITYGAVPVSES